MNLKTAIFVVTNIFLTLFLVNPHLVNAQNIETDVVLFYGEGCPHCAKMLDFIEKTGRKYNGTKIHRFEVYFQTDNIPLFQKIAEAYGTGIEAVPTLFVGDRFFVGFSNAIGEEIESVIVGCLENGCISPLSYIGMERKNEEIDTDIKPRENEENQVILPVQSSQGTQADESAEINVPEEDQIAQANEENKNTENMAKSLTLPAVIGAALVDAINPCEFAVLILLMTTILAASNRKRALFAGLAFSLSIFISYFLMGLGLYSAVQASGISQTFYIVIAVLAILIGLFNLKDYFWYGKWFLMEVPLSWRPRLQALLRGITSVPGAFFVGFAVSLFLLPCTSGPYIVILGLLAYATTKSYAISLLVLYNLIFITPMVLITLAIALGMTTTEQAENWRKSKLKTLHLIAGLILLALGIFMLGSVWMGYM